MTWDEGWLRGARQVRSPNHGPRPAGATLTLALLHSISLPPGEFGGDAIDRLFTNTLDWNAHPYFQQICGAEVSAHFVIDRHGQLTQYVSVLDRAWHAGQSSWRGRDNCNDYAVGIELEGLEGGTFEPAQYDTALRLLRSLRRTFGIAQVAGHEHVAPGRKADPGPGFDWRQLKARLRWAARSFPP